MVGIEALWPYKHKTHRTCKPSYPQTLLLALRHSQGRICTCLMLNASSNYCNQSWCRSLMFLKGWLCEALILQRPTYDVNKHCRCIAYLLEAVFLAGLQQRCIRVFKLSDAKTADHTHANGVIVAAKCTLASFSEEQAQRSLVHACIHKCISKCYIVL